MCNKNCRFGCGLPCHRQREGDHGAYHICGRGPDPVSGCPGLVKFNAERKKKEEDAAKQRLAAFRIESAKKKQKFDTLVEKFISEPRLSNYGGWAPITEDDVALAYQILELLGDMKCPRDGDGDPTLEFEVVNRSTHDRFQSAFNIYQKPPQGPKKEKSAK